MTLVALSASTFKTAGPAGPRYRGARAAGLDRSQVEPLTDEALEARIY